MKVLFSKSTKRVIWHNGNSAVTAQLTDNLQFDNYIHDAPIGIWDMANAFTNLSIKDWIECDITLWTDLQNA